jgi:hypothetical protein
MTEQPTPYQVGRPKMTREQKEQVMHSAYFQAVASTTDSMIMGGLLIPGREEYLMDRAIAFTDQLIEKVGKKV